MVDKQIQLISSTGNRGKVTITSWQKRMDAAVHDYDARKLLVFECLDEIGIDTTQWKERKDLE